MSHSTLGNGEFLKVGSSLFSPDGSTEFKMQGDGKIAVYWGGECRFQNTANQRSDIKGLQLGEDGILRLLDNNGNSVWESNNDAPGDSTVVCTVQNDGNVVLYKGTPIWASNTGH